MRASRAVRARVLASLVALAVAGCTGSPGGLPEVRGEIGEPPDVRITGDPPSTLTVETVLAGDGARVGENGVIVAELTTFPWREGEERAAPRFSSYDLGTVVLLSTARSSEIFPEGSSALAGRRQGGRVAVYVPSEGTGADTGEEPPRSGDLHIVDIIDTYAAGRTVNGEMAAPDDPALPTVDIARSGRPTVSVPESDPPNEAREVSLITGDGAEIRRGDRVVVQYTGVTWTDGTEFDSTWEWGGRPTVFSLGSGQTIPGWENGLIGNTVGSRLLLVVPPDEGYGAAGNEVAGIPPNETLVYLVDVLGAH